MVGRDVDKAEERIPLLRIPVPSEARGCSEYVVAAGAAQASFCQACGAPESQVEDPRLAESTSMTFICTHYRCHTFIGAIVVHWESLFRLKTGSDCLLYIPIFFGYRQNYFQGK